MNLFVSTASDDLLFARLRDDQRLAQNREFINALYNDRFQPFADRDFPNKFAVQCLSSFWEMYLACCLMQGGFKLVPRKDLPIAGPDLCIQQDDTRVWIEAVTPGIGTGADSLPPIKEQPPDRTQRVPEDQIVLRFCSSIKDKYDLHIRHIDKRLVSENDPFLVALNGAGIPEQFRYTMFPDDVPYAIQAVLPFGPYSLTVDTESRQIRDEGFQHREYISKLSGSKVPTNTFLDSSFGLISALIFSNAHPFSTNEASSGQLSLLRNCSTSHPLGGKWFEFGLQWWLEQHEDRYVLQRRRYPSGV